MTSRHEKEDQYEENEEAKTKEEEEEKENSQLFVLNHFHGSCRAWLHLGRAVSTFPDVPRASFG